MREKRLEELQKVLLQLEEIANRSPKWDMEENHREADSLLLLALEEAVKYNGKEETECVDRITSAWYSIDKWFS